ncbi:MAG: 4'-phosphopantetheinyl transferase family protein [Janthinobacterium lividum]
MPFHSFQLLPDGATLSLWHLTETPADLWPQLANPAAYAPLLPARADGPRQAQWLASRLLVQYLLRTAAPGAILPLLQNEDSGRPCLVGPGPQPALSLSHSGEWVAALLAPAGAAVGVDIEVVRDKAQRLARKFLNDPELAAAKAISTSAAGFPGPLELFSLLWSAKETLYKLAGQRGVIFRENLLLDLPTGPCPAAGTLPARLNLPGCNSRHQICYLTPAAGYVLTYCVAFI